MNTSLLFKNAILRLYKQKHYTVDNEEVVEVSEDTEENVEAEE